jgi:hypothetical protein
LKMVWGPKINNVIFRNGLRVKTIEKTSQRNYSIYTYIQLSFLVSFF